MGGSDRGQRPGAATGGSNRGQRRATARLFFEGNSNNSDGQEVGGGSDGWQQGASAMGDKDGPQ